MRRERAIFLGVVVLLLGLVISAVALRWDELVDAGKRYLAERTDQSPPSWPPASPAGNEPGDYSIYSLISDVRGCATVSTSVEPNEFQSDTSPEDALPAITESVEGLRGISFDREVPSEFLLTEDFLNLVERKLQNFAPSEAEARAISEVYENLEAIGPGVNLQEEIEKLFSEVAGLYLPIRDKLLVSISGDGLSATEEIVLSHELAHALVDQSIGLPPLGRYFKRDDDRFAAVQALTEGDASMLELQYAIALMSFDRREQMGEEYANRPVVSVPYIVEQRAAFPYDGGMRFACYFYLQDGWQSVNRLFDDPPRTTAEILFPYRYEEGIEPEDPADPPSPGEGWKRVTGSTFGATELMWLLEAPEGQPIGEPGDAAGDVMAWNGGEYNIYEHDKSGEVAFHIGLVDGWTDVAPSGVKPDPLSVVMTEWTVQNWPEALQKPAEGVPSGTTWRHDGTVYILSTEGKQIGLAAAPTYEVAAALAGK